jgi:hypothetical protein
LNFPRILFNTGETLGIAVSNPSMDTASLQLTAITASGQQLQGAGLLNPTTIVLPAQGQAASLDTELFGNAASSLGDFWFHVVAPNPDLKGFFLIGDFVNSIVGTEENGALFMDSILPSVRPGEENRFSIINPLPITASVTLDLITNSGRVLQSLMRNIPLYGMLQGRVQDLYSAYSQIGEGGYLRLRSVTGVRSYQQFVPLGRKDPAGLNAQSAISGPSTLVFSHFVAGREGGTGVNYETRAGLINLETTGQSALLSIRDDRGNLLAVPQSISLPASGRVDPELRSLFSLSSERLTQGWLKVEGTGRLAGYVTYSNGKAFAAVVSLAEPRNQLVFSQVAEEGTGFYTGLAVLNTNTENVLISISVYSRDGLLIAETNSPYSIPPNGRIMGLLNQLVGPEVIGQSGGYVLITSSLPIHGIEIFGTSNGQAFANVPAQ